MTSAPGVDPARSAAVVMGTLTRLPQVVGAGPHRVDIDDLRGQLTCTVETAAAALQISRGSAYAAVRDGTIPHLRLGNRILVKVPALLELCGATVTEQ